MLGAVDYKVMSFGFAANSFADRRKKECVLVARSQRVAQVGRVVLAKAHVKSAGAGQAHAITAFTKIVAERSDQS